MTLTLTKMKTKTKMKKMKMATTKISPLDRCQPKRGRDTRRIWRMEKIGYEVAQVSMKIWRQRQEESVGELSMVMGVSVKWI